MIPEFKMPNITLVSNAEMDKRIAQEQDAERQQKVKALMGDSGMPDRHRRAPAGKLVDATDWFKRLQKTREMLGSGFIVALAGTRGNGKTQLACELMKYSCHALRSAYFLTATRFFMTIKATYKEGNSETEMDVIDRFRKPRLLVIDEIGKRAESEWHSTLLFELMNSRYEDLTDTVVIDNRSVADLSQLLGASLISRINQTGGVIECNWPSFR